MQAPRACTGYHTEMRKEMTLPDSFLTLIQKYGIGEKDVIFAAAADLDMEYRFADSIVALTKERLLFAAYPYQEKRESASAAMRAGRSERRRFCWKSPPCRSLSWTGSGTQR